MGRDKGLIELDGVPLIARVVEQTRAVCSEVIIVTHNPVAYERFGARLIGDVFPGKGSLGGIFSGLQAARESYALAVACDMPFLNPALLRYLIALAPLADVVIPRAGGPSGNPLRRRNNAPQSEASFAKASDLHPAHAVYSKRCLPAIEERLRAGDLRLIGFLDAVNVRLVGADEIDRFDPEHLSLFNMNTPEDLQIAIELDNSRRRGILR